MEEAPGEGEMEGGGSPILNGAAKGRPAVRQLPGSHAVAGGELPACLAWEEDALAPLGWASSAGPGGPGKVNRWLRPFIFFLLCFSSVICFGSVIKILSQFIKMPK